MKKIVMIGLSVFIGISSVAWSYAAEPTKGLICKGQNIGAPQASAKTGAPAPAPYVIATCVPKDGGLPFAALTNKCDQAWLQGGCDRYINTPGFGPSTATKDCKQFKSADDFSAYLKSLQQSQQITQLLGKKELKPFGTFVEALKKKKAKIDLKRGAPVHNPRWAGLGGSVVLCKTRVGKTLFAVPSNGASCDDKDAQQCACNTNHGIADPVACTDFVSDVEKNPYLDKYKKRFGLECKLDAGISERVIVPDCSKPVLDTECSPKEGVVTACGVISNDQSVLDKWAGTFTNTAVVKCKIKKTGDTFSRPAADCSKDTQKKACPGDEMEPSHCKKYDSAKEMGFALGKVPS